MRTRFGPQRAVGTVDSWRLRQAEAGSRTLDRVLARSSDLVPATAPTTMVKMILFGEDSARLDGRARAVLQELSAALKADPGIRVVIGGFAGQSGATAYAMALGLQRVQAIRAFVLSQGIDPARVEVALRGSKWSLVARPCGATETAPHGECRLQIADPKWALSRS